MAKLEDLLKALLKNRLKILPTKCQLFKIELQYMGNTIFIKDRKVCVKPLRSRIEATLKLEPPKMPQGCRSFAGMVNFLSMFCLELQKLLKPIYDLTRKGRPSVWGEEQQESFEQIKKRLVCAPVLHIPNRQGRFDLFLDSSKAVRSYLITELELCSLAINIASFSQLLKRVDFDAIVDHLALRHIIKSKAEPATTKIKRLLELISSYLFNLYYMKGKDMILSNFLSRQMHDTSDPNKIIPILLNMYKTLHEVYYKDDPIDRYLVQMCSQMKMAGVKLPEVHGARKTIPIHSPIEKQKPQIPERQVDNKRPKLGRGRAGMQHKQPQPVADTSVLTNKSLNIPTTQEVTMDSSKYPEPKQLLTHRPETSTTRQVQDRIREYPCQLDPYFRPPPRPPDNLWPRSPKSNMTNESDTGIEFEENLPHQEGIISKIYQRPNRNYFQEPKDLESLVDTSEIVKKFLQKLADIDKILKIIQCKVLKGLHLSTMVKEIQAGYLNSVYFKDIYLYLSQDILPNSKIDIRKVETLAEKYILLYSLLFKITVTPDKEGAVLSIPETCADSIIALFHSSLFTGHQGVIKTYLTISDKFFIPNLTHYLWSYIKVVIYAN